MKKTPWVSMILLLWGSPLFGVEPTVSHYRIANRFHVEGDGRWDLLAIDASAGRLFLSHETLVQVLDTKNGRIVGVIPDTKGVHGIALAKDQNKGFITCGKDNSVTIFNLETLKVEARVPVNGTSPDAILYEPSSQRVFSFNGRSSNATVIDGKTNEVIGSVALDGKPELATTDGKGTVFVNLEDRSLIHEINAKTLKVEQSWPLAPGEEPSGLAMDTVNHRLFAGCHNKLMVVMDSETGKILATLPIGERVDGVGFDPEMKRVYSSNGDGTLTVIEELDKDSFQVLENVVTQKGAKTLAVDSQTHHIFLPVAEFLNTPQATPDNPKPRPAIKPGTFVVLDVEPVK